MWNRWTCWLAAVLLISACSQGTLTRVVRTDGTAVVGELVAARPDAVVVKVADGSSITIPRSVIRSIESASANAAAPASSTTAASGSGAATTGGSATGGAATSGGATSGGATSGSGSATSGRAAGGNAATGNSGANTGGTRGGGASSGNVASNGTPTSGATSGTATSSGSATGGATSGSGATGGGATGNASTSSGGAGTLAREAIAPGGTMLELTLNTPIGSDTSAVDDKVDAVLRAPLMVNGAEILGAGTTAHGVVVEATPSSKAAGRGRLIVRFETIQIGPKSLPIQTAPVRWEASGVAKRPEPESGNFFKRVVSKTKKGLRIGDEERARGSADVHFAAGAVVRIRLEQPARIAP